MLSPESTSTKHISLSRQCYLKIAGFALGLATVATILTSASSARPSLIDHEALNDARIATAARDGLTYGYLLGRESMEEDVNKAREDGYREGVESEQNEPAQADIDGLSESQDGTSVMIGKDRWYGDSIALLDGDPNNGASIVDKYVFCSDPDIGYVVRRVDIDDATTYGPSVAHLFSTGATGFVNAEGELVYADEVIDVVDYCNLLLEWLKPPRELEEAPTGTQA